MRDKEIDLIKSEAALQDSFLRLHHAELKFIERKPECIIWENLSDENLQKLIDKSIELEYFRATITLIKQQDKRKSF